VQAVHIFSEYLPEVIAGCMFGGSGLAVSAKHFLLLSYLRIKDDFGFHLVTFISDADSRPNV